MLIDLPESLQALWLTFLTPADWCATEATCRSLYELGCSGSHWYDAAVRALPFEAMEAMANSRWSMLRGDSGRKNGRTMAPQGEQSFGLLDYKTIMAAATNPLRRRWVPLEHATSGQKEHELPPRFGHTSTLIGRQLVVFGGRHGDQCLGDCHVLDLDTWAWSPAPLTTEGLAPLPRRGHSAVALHGDTVLVLGGGGMGVGPASTMGDHWALRLKPAPPLPTEATTTKGGDRNASSSLESSSSSGGTLHDDSQSSATEASAPSDTVSWQWEKLPMVWAQDPSLKGLGGDSTAAGVLGGGTGAEDTDENMPESELHLDPVMWDTDRWASLGHSATVLNVGTAEEPILRVAVFGGSYDTAHDVFGLLLLYDPENNEWHLPESGAGPGQVTGAPPMPRYRHAACGIPAKNTHPSNNNSTVTSEGSSSVVIWGGFAPSFISDEPFADVHVLEVVPSTTPQGNKEAKKKQKKDPWALRWSEVAMAGPPPTPAGSAALAWLGGSVVALFGMTGFCSHAMTFGTNPANLFLPEEKDSSQVAVFRVADYTVANDDEGGDKEALQGEEARDYTWHYDADPYNRNSGDLTKSSKDGGGFVEASSSSFSGNTNDVPYRPAVRCGATANVVCTPSGDVGILVLGGRRYQRGLHFGRNDAHLLLYEAGPGLDRRRLGVTVNDDNRASPHSAATTGAPTPSDAVSDTTQTARVASVPQTPSLSQAPPLLLPPPPPPADWPTSRAMLVPALVRRRARVELRRPLSAFQTLGGTSFDLASVALGAAGAGEQAKSFGEVQDFESTTGEFLVQIDGTTKDSSGASLVVSVRPCDIRPLPPEF